MQEAGLNREQALGAMGSLAGESGRNLNTKAYNPNDPNGGSYGIGQWHSERRTALEQFAANHQYGIDDYRTQVDFIAHELETTHKHVKDAMVQAPTRAKATDVWTKQYEVPHKNYEKLSERRANANYYAKIADVGPKSPQQAVDGVHSIGTAVTQVADASLTGAQLPGNDLSYVESLPRTDTGTRRAERQKGPFEGFLSGIPNALGEVVGATPANTSEEVAADAAARNSSAGESAPAQGAKSNDGFWGDTTPGAIIGSLAGGYFLGPLGAVVGGLMGQGVSKALSGIPDTKQKKADEEEADGMLGGVGRAVDGLFGGLFGGGKPKDTSMSAGLSGLAAQSMKDMFPSAPEAPANRGGNGQSGYAGLGKEGRELYEGSQQVRDVVDSGSAGLY